MPRWFAAPIIAGCLVAGACATTPAAPEAAYGPCGDTHEELVAAAKKEGSVSIHGQPADWAGTGLIVDAFEAKYGITVNSYLPELDSQGQLTVLRTWPGDPRFPDVVEMSPAVMDQAVNEGLITRFQPPAAADVPAAFRDPNGYWFAPYGGFIAFGVDPGTIRTAPSSWADLRGPEYRNAVALRADPRTSGVGAEAVVAAALANGGDLADVSPGLDFFADLWATGNLRNGTASVNDLRHATEPIIVDWAFNIRAIDANVVDPGHSYELVLPSDGLAGAVYAGALTALAPHPCAGRLWLDELLSRPVQVIRAKAGAVPPGVAALRDDPGIDERTRRLLPTDESLTRLVRPTSDQAQNLVEQISVGWSQRLPGWSPS